MSQTHLPATPDPLKEAFQNLLPRPAQLDPRLSQTLSHVLAHPGSLIRARLVHRMARAYHLPEPTALHLAISVEYFHTASLVFDDLPCMDNATQRRNAPCPHVLFGESAAVLAALGLINRAYALLWEAMIGLPELRQRQISRYVEACLGTAGVLHGQSCDLHGAGPARTARQVLQVALGKTVSLIRLTLVLPALLGGATSGEIRHWERLALWWGLGYQMLDDLKDVHVSGAGAGKTAGRDSTLNRPNLALAEGTREAVRRVVRLVRLGDRLLDRLPASGSRWAFLGELRERFTQELRPYAQEGAEEAAA